MRGTDQSPPLSNFSYKAIGQGIQCQFFEALGQSMVSHVSTRTTFAGKKRCIVAREQPEAETRSIGPNCGWSSRSSKNAVISANSMSLSSVEETCRHWRSTSLFKIETKRTACFAASSVYPEVSEDHTISRMPHHRRAAHWQGARKPADLSQIWTWTLCLLRFVMTFLREMNGNKERIKGSQPPDSPKPMLPGDCIRHSIAFEAHGQSHWNLEIMIRITGSTSPGRSLAAGAALIGPRRHRRCCFTTKPEERKMKLKLALYADPAAHGTAYLRAVHRAHRQCNGHE